MSSRKGRKRKLEKELDEIVLQDSVHAKVVREATLVESSVLEVSDVLAGQSQFCEPQRQSQINKGSYGMYINSTVNASGILV